MSHPYPTLDMLPGEGESRTVTVVRVRKECGTCGEPAHYRHAYLVEGNARRNPASSAYGRDDCSYCSDHEEMTCRDCERPRVAGYEWIATYPATAQFAHMFLAEVSR